MVIFSQYRYDIYVFHSIEKKLLLSGECLFRLMEAGESEVDGCRAKSVIAYVLATEYLVG